MIAKMFLQTYFACKVHAVELFLSSLANSSRELNFTIVLMKLAVLFKKQDDKMIYRNQNVKSSKILYATFVILKLIAFTMSHC